MVFFLKENLRIGPLVFSLKPEKIQVRGWDRAGGATVNLFWLCSSWSPGIGPNMSARPTHPGCGVRGRQWSRSPQTDVAKLRVLRDADEVV